MGVKFEEALVDLQTLVTSREESLQEVFTALQDGDEERAVDILRAALDFAEWDTAFINNLPDSSFAYIAPGGKKDDGGKTVPRSLRHFPYKNANGDVDLPHLRNALARAPQSPFGPKAMPKLTAAAKSAGVGKPAEKKASEVFSDGWCFGAELAEIGKPIQVIKTGKFEHPVHGEITITISDLNEMVKNFNDHVRGQQIPVDVDHKHEMGAVGWFKSLSGPTRVNGEHALFADIEWTNEGAKSVKGGAFKYFSPHFGDWVHPETGAKYNNVLLSGAITNFPFLKGMQPISFNEFKEGHMGDNGDVVTVEQFNALTASVNQILAANARREFSDRIKSAEKMSEEDKETLIGEIKASTALSDDDKGALTKLVEEKEAPEAGGGESGDDDKRFAEIQGREAELTKQLTEANAEISKIKREARTVRFMETIGGVGDDPAWVGDTAKHLSLMEGIADKFGEESKEFKDYCELQNSHARQLKESGLLTEVGTNGHGPETTNEELVAGVKALMEADPKMSQAQATTKWIADNQKAYNEFNATHMKKIAEAGG